MPLYEYRCGDGHTFEVMQRMSDDPVRTCEVCGEPVQRVFHPVAVHFKGSGFYSTDYGKKRSGSGSSDSSGAQEGGSGESGEGSSSGESKGESKGDSGGSDKKSDGGKSESKQSD